MLGSSRWTGLACFLLLVAAGCGGSSNNTPITGPDANSDSSINEMGDGASEPDSTVGTTDANEPTDSTVGTNDAPVATDDGSMTTTAEAGPDAAPDGALEAGPTEGGASDAATTDAGNGSACSTNANCANGHCVGSICCASACSPTDCQKATCADGVTCAYSPLTDGSSCNTHNACTSGDHCVSGTCTAGPAVSCDDGNPCTTDSCDPVVGCKNQNNTAACNDGNPCTTSDTCSNGLCSGTPVDCSGAAYNDQCNVGVCSAGTCVKSPKSGTPACNDGNACTITDTCNAGTCTGTGNSCGTNATGCTNGNPPTCTCTTGYVNQNGTCILSTGGCSTNPCVAGATCTDGTAGAFTCTCPAGFTGDGKKSGTGCTQIDNCVGNPCGAGLGTCVNGVNTYTCNCNAGYVSVNNKCECDMNGTFAAQVSLTTSWPAIQVLGTPVFAAGTNVPTTTWAIRQQTYDSTGQLVIKMTSCGGTTADLCGLLAPSTGFGNAYTEFLPSTIYGTSSMPVQTLSFSLPTTLPGSAYTEPQNAALLGISLTDPLGAWPASRTNVGVGASTQTNGAVWVDNDNDGVNGVTSYSVPPGGISTSTPPLPLENYPATSTECNKAYAYLENVTRVYSASRFISSATGTISTCDSTGVTRITGTLNGGPGKSEPTSDARVYGCLTGTGASQADCSSSLVSQFDGQSQTQQITSASFIIKRVASSVTCADVRAMTF